MRSHRSYHVSECEKGRTTQQDQSYKSCITALFFFCVLCVVLILASWPWKKGYKSEDDTQWKAAKIQGSGYDDNLSSNSPIRQLPEETTNTIATTPEKIQDPIFFVTISERSKENKVIKSTDSTATSQTTASSTITITTEETTKSVLPNTTSKEIQKDEIIEPNAIPRNSTTASSITPVTTTEESTESNFSETISKDQIIESNTIPTNSSTTASLTTITTTTEESTKSDFPNTKEIQKDQITEPNAFPRNSTTASSITLVTTTEGSMESNLSETTPKDQIIESNAIHTNSSTTASSSTMTTITEESTKSNIPENTSKELQKDEIAESNTTPTSSITPSGTTITIATEGTIKSNSPVTKPEELEEDKNTKIICNKEKCKRAAGKIIPYINYYADACEDFYEYACGEIEVDKNVPEKDLKKHAHELIREQMIESKNLKEPFYRYYQSCLDYSRSIDKNLKIQWANEAIKEIGEFHTEASWPDLVEFTELFTNLLLQHHSALLFDIIPDVNETNPNSFTLSVTPPMRRSPFAIDTSQNLCYKPINHTERDVNLTNYYEEYRSCKKSVKPLLDSTEKALDELNVFRKMENLNSTDFNDTIRYAIESDIHDTFLQAYPPEDTIRLAYTSKKYTTMSIRELQDTTPTLINWTVLISKLTGQNIPPETQLQVYFKDILIEGLRNLEITDKRNLSNGLLALYARDIYEELVAPKPGNDEDYCLEATINLLEAQASSLYLSSFSSSEFNYMSETIRRIFNELKETLKIKIDSADWYEEDVKKILLNKANAIKLSTPDITSYKDDEENKINLSGNYLKDSINLMKRYRKAMYAEFTKNPSDQRQIWSHFALPFHSTGQAVYGLNMIIIPFGAIDWSFYSYSNSFDHITYATLGYLIGHEVSHHFDANGLRYWDNRRQNDALLTSNSDYQAYIHCHTEDVIKDSIKMTLPRTEQSIKFKLNDLTLNERIADVTGLRLAHDTFARLAAFREESQYLPFLEEGVEKQFYLAYAQMHCTKRTFAESYISLYEDEHLLSRVRIFVTTTNDELFGDAWKCPEGSKMNPPFRCGTFPYLHETE